MDVRFGTDLCLIGMIIVEVSDLYFLLFSNNDFAIKAEKLTFS